MLVDLDALASEAHRLEPLPASTTRLFQVLTAEDWSVSDIEDVVRLDPTLTGRVLSLANSAYCQGVRRISSLREAVVRLGGVVVVGVAVALAARDRLQVELPGYGAKAGDLWRHSVASLLAAEEMVAGYGAPPDVITAALLHDIGKLLLCQQADLASWRYVELAQSAGSLTQVRAESEIFEVHHGELGGLMAQRWGLPESVAVAVIHHHEPECVMAEPHRAMCRTTYLADRIAHRIGCGLGASASPEAIDPRVLEGAGLVEADLERLCARVADRFEATLEAYA